MIDQMQEGIDRQIELLDEKQDTIALQQGKLLFSPVCTDCIREFGLYCWDEKAPEDRPLKENDHAMDEVRYFVSTIMCGDIHYHAVKGGI